MPEKFSEEAFWRALWAWLTRGGTTDPVTDPPETS